MSQKTVDPKPSEPENGQIGLSGDPKPQPAVVKKTPLRDLPNENNVVVSKSAMNSMISKEGDTDGAKAVGTKRPCPDSPAYPSHHQSPGGNSVNGHLVYVRRKAETEAGKNNSNSTEDPVPEMPDNNSAISSQPMPVVTQAQQAIPEEKPQPKDSAPIPPAASMDTSGNPPVPLSDGKPINKPVPSESHSHPATPVVPINKPVPSESHSHPATPIVPINKPVPSESHSHPATPVVPINKPVPSESHSHPATPVVPINKPVPSESHSHPAMPVVPINKPVPSESNSHPATPVVPSSERKRMNDQNWEERYIQLQMFLKRLEHSSLEEYLEKLRALPAAELSRHAVELENRAIQLSLDEGYELKRVKTLDVLGKSKTSKPATVQPVPPQS